MWRRRENGELPLLAPKQMVFLERKAPMGSAAGSKEGLDLPISGSIAAKP
jgi:hypothetical protein